MEHREQERKEIERLRARIAELEHMLEIHEWGGQLFHESTIPQLLLDLDTGEILMANRASVEFFGVPLEELVGKPLAQFSAKVDCWTPELVERICQHRYGVEPATYCTKNRAIREVEAHYSLVSLRGRPVIHVFLNDITEKLRAQRELEQNYERYYTFIQLANEGIWCYEATEPIPTDLPVEEQMRLIYERGYLAECNLAYARMYGYDDPSELIGARFGARWETGNPLNESLLRAFIENGYRIEQLESVDIDRLGQPRIILNSAVGIIEDGKLMRAWGVQTDITEQRKLQEALEHARRLETIGRIAGGITHDFNNLLTAILGYAELALQRIEDETLHRYLEGIQKACDRASNLTRQLLAYARRQALQPRRINLTEWLTENEELLQRVLPENIRIVLEIASGEWYVRGDPNQLLQALLNLVVNARDAMPNGGTITLSLGLMQREGRSFICLRVSDTGTGIRPEDLPHIFEPFFTTKPLGQGTGLGLSAVEGIVQQLGGTIEVESTLGKGTTFFIYLPPAE